jgi:hypothetical protein
MPSGSFAAPSAQPLAYAIACSAVENEDRELLWEALGLDEMLDRRREQLGLPSLFPEHTPGRIRTPSYPSETSHS